jgi:CheY-like chemotaxis protein
MPEPGSAVSPPPRSTGRKRTLLLVDDEENILSSMKRLLRTEGYELLTATSGERGLQLLEEHPIDVIVSDQRMPGMSGVEFLRQARTRYPESIRIVLSGYTELQSITNAINEGAIYKFLTKPWEDEQLRTNIAEAFQQKELADENRRLSCELQRANQQLAHANAQLQDLLAEREGRIGRHETAIAVLHEVLEMLPWPFLGIDDDGLIVTLNAGAEALFGSRGALIGRPISDAMPEHTETFLHAASTLTLPVVLDEAHYLVQCRPLGTSCDGRGKAITFVPQEADRAG